METTTLVAPDISCEHCQHAIEGALGELAGVNTVRVDIPTKTVNLSYDPQKITLTINVKDSSGKGQPYTLALAGQRRQS